MLAVTDKDKKIASKSHHEKLLVTQLACDAKSLSQADTVSSLPHLFNKDMIRKSISKKRNGNAAGASAVVSERGRRSRGWRNNRPKRGAVDSRGLPLGTKGRLYSACVHSVTLNRSETWSVNKERET